MIPPLKTNVEELIVLHPIVNVDGNSFRDYNSSFKIHYVIYNVNQNERKK